MPAVIWKPNVVVAVVAERQGRYLVVEERVNGRLVINQPAGHLDEGETLIQAAVRETLEETAWHFRPEGLVGVYLYPSPDGKTFLRFCFHGEAYAHEPELGLDREIQQVLWLSRAELEQQAERLRSPLVLHCLGDYEAGRRHPLDLITHLGFDRSDAA